MAIPPWASLALFVVGGALFVADRSDTLSRAMKAVGGLEKSVISEKNNEQAWQERAATADAEVESLRKQNDKLQDKVESLQSEISQLTHASGAKDTPQQPIKISPRAVVNSVGMTLLEISAGNFQMGEGFDSVAVTLTLPFLLGKTEVTRGQWEQVMGTSPWGGSGDKSDAELPAVNVSWDDAIEFCDKLTSLERSSGDLQANESYRLPTEAEWEYACRAGTTTKYSFGDDEKLLGDFSWFPGNALNAHPVGTKKPNSWGLHDMHGNVWEWCSDWYDGKLAGGIDPVGPAEGSNRVSRGGSWRKDPGLCRSADRGQSVRAKRDRNLGFRVARSLSGAESPEAGTDQGTKTIAPSEDPPPAAVIASGSMPISAAAASTLPETIGAAFGINLKLIPAGTFTMGDAGGESDEKPHRVTLTKPFYMGVHEVTNAQWKQVMGNVPSKWKEDAHPVEVVSWEDAVEFCGKLSALPEERKAGRVYRLPTEAEWEYACRAGTTTK